MKIDDYIKSNQEQGLASWINYLNQVRINTLVNSLSKQEGNFRSAMDTMNKSLEIIKVDIVENNLGAQKGMHGFIAEVAEVGIGNAKEEILGNSKLYEWVNNNSPTDIIKDSVNIQMKFSAYDGAFSMNAVINHLKDYPDYITEGGKYQIPKDHYEEIKKYLSIPEDVANKLPTSTGDFSLSKWKKFNNLFTEGSISIDDVEPSILKYDEVQIETYKNTFEKEKENLSDKNKEIKDNAYIKSKPSLKEGTKATVYSSAIEGGTSLIIEINKKKKQGKNIKDFNEKDWIEVAGGTTKGFIKGGVRGMSIYSLTNYTTTPAAVASALTSASFAVAEQAHLFRKGEIDELTFIKNSELLCLDVSISALSSFVGQAFIPIPVLGAVIGNSVGTIIYQIGKGKLSEKEQAIISEYYEELKQIDKDIGQEYKETVNKLMENFSTYIELVESAFSPDIQIALLGSVNLAKELGVSNKELLATHKKINEFFLT